MFTVHGLELLAELATKAGKAEYAAKCTAKAAPLRAAVLKHMWDSKAGRFCDGICTDEKVSGHHGIYSDMYPLWMGLVPEGFVANVWKALAAWGIEQIGDCAFHSLCSTYRLPSMVVAPITPGLIGLHATYLVCVRRELVSAASLCLSPCCCVDSLF